MAAAQVGLLPVWATACRRRTMVPHLPRVEPTEPRTSGPPRMDLLRAVFHQYFLTPGQRSTIGVDLDPAPEAGLGSVGPAPMAAAES